VDITSLGFRTDVMLRALEGSDVVDRGDYLAVRTPANPDFYWGNFLLLPGQAADGEAAPWLSRFAAEFPAAAHVALGLDVTGGTPAGLASFAAAGLELQRSTVLTAPAVREPPRPNRAAVCRPLASDRDWRLAARLQERCDQADGVPASPAFAQARTSARRHLVAAGHGVWFGAFLDGELAAQLGVFRGTGPIARYQDVMTHPAARRQGLAGTLVSHAGRAAIDQLGAKALVIVADPGEAAIRVYRSVGFASRESQVSLQRVPGAPPGPGPARWAAPAGGADDR
jgi:ribosomal protein S18 acetylase RimI-like enzyme